MRAKPHTTISCDPAQLLTLLYKNLAWSGTTLPQVDPAEDLGEQLVGFRVRRDAGRVEHYFVEEKSLWAAKPGHIADNIWAAFRSKNGRRHLADALGRGVPLDKLSARLNEASRASGSA